MSNLPNVLSPRDLVFRPDYMEETVQHTGHRTSQGAVLDLLTVAYWLYPRSCFGGEEFGT